jgi:N-acetylneuraminic acid mutarotase
MKAITLAAALLIPMSLVGPNAALAANGAWSSTTDPDAIRGSNTATLLKDGRVFVVGSLGNEMTAEIYDPTSATWTRQADPIRTRTIPPASATLLSNGRVLLVGGDALNGYKTSEVFDPSDGAWTVAADLNIPRWYGEVTALADGRVLIAGGVPPGGVNYLRAAEIYDPTRNTWTITGSMVQARPWFTMATLRDGTVLAAGGHYANITSEVYNPVTGTWSKKSSATVTGAEQQFTLTVLRDGRALAVGGLYTHHLYDPISKTWRATAPPDVTAYFTTATLLQDATVLVAGTDYCCSASSNAFHPSTETWLLTGALVQRPRQHHSAALLNDGRVLVVGGYYEGPPCNEGTCTTYELQSAEIFTPSGP